MKNLTWQNPEQLFVAQELINKVKSKCCGIKVIERKMQEKNHYPCFDWTYTIGNITEKKRDEMQRLIKEYGGGYVI